MLALSILTLSKLKLAGLRLTGIVVVSLARAKEPLASRVNEYTYSNRYGERVLIDVPTMDFL